MLCEADGMDGALQTGSRVRRTLERFSVSIVEPIKSVTDRIGDTNVYLIEEQK